MIHISLGFEIISNVVCYLGQTLLLDIWGTFPNRALTVPWILSRLPHLLRNERKGCLSVRWAYQTVNLLSIGSIWEKSQRRRNPNSYLMIITQTLWCVWEMTQLRLRQCSSTVDVCKHHVNVSHHNLYSAWKFLPVHRMENILHT